MALLQKPERFSGPGRLFNGTRGPRPLSGVGPTNGPWLASNSASGRRSKPSITGFVISILLLAVIGFLSFVIFF